jgi:fructosamine-3-kinase
MTRADEVVAAFESVAGRRVRGVRAVAGGDINDALQLECDDGRLVFVKTRADAPAGEFAAEADALRWLAEPAGLRVPAVIAVGEGRVRFLALEWVAGGRLSRAGREELGRGLAIVHRAGAAAFGAVAPDAGFGVGSGVGGDEGARAWRVGPVALPNAPCERWPEFYAERRLRPLALVALARGGLSPSGREAIERVCERIESLCGPDEPPARLHGDLWSGNVLADADGLPWLIDPLAYGGHREIDLAMLRLFGDPGPEVLGAYDEVFPLAPGHEQRVALWQLLPLLVHAALFRGGYGRSAEAAARRYVG